MSTEGPVTGVPLLDLKAQFRTIEADVRAAIDRVVESQRFIMGPEVEALEGEIAAYCGAAHAIGVSSGTDALLVALMALGVGAGDEVITSTYSFFASGGVIARLGARPVFVDIDPETFNIDPDGVKRAVSDRTRAIIPVHLFGQCAEMDPILELAAARGIAVVEDAAQALGAGYEGRPAGTMGDLGCFSFFPSKNLGAYGDGGMVVTGDEALAKRVRALRVHGAQPKYYHAIVGGNFRLDAIQAAVLRAKLPHLDAWSEGRRINAAFYDRALTEAGLVEAGKVRLPTFRHAPHVVNQYAIVCEQRDALKAHLAAKSIGTEVYYPVPLHRQECFADLGYGVGSLPVAERAATETLALPVYPELTESQMAYVVEAVRDFYG